MRQYSISGVDDGAALMIFNSDSPAGALDDATASHLGSAVTADLSTALVPGVNRIVLIHVDDCCLDSNIQGATITWQGSPVPACD